MEFFSSLKTEDVIVPAEFIDSFMASANGDYVKVYLWLLKNGSADIEEMAEKLRLTEGDVKRAIAYWQERSVLGKRKETPVKAAAMAAPAEAASLRERYRGTQCTEILNRLADDAEFRELLIIVQKYLSKILGERETEVFAYLYDGLHLPAEVLDYLVAYAVEHEHTGIRYIEKLGTDWAENGVRDVKSAKRRTKQFEENARAAAAGKAAAKKDAAKPAAGTPRTDYNELVMQELLQNMGD